MFSRPSVLCPTDFSEASRGALRYGAALAEHFYADLVVLAVDDPFLTDAAAAAMDPHFLERQTRAALATFVDETFADGRPAVPELKMAMTTGRPAEEILRYAATAKSDVIVMSTHGASGVRKMVFGSVTERLLRKTHLPVVVTPGADPGPASLEAWKAATRRVLVPVDFSDWTPQQVSIARGLAEALGSELVFAHVLPRTDDARRLEVHHQLDAMIRSVPARLSPAMTIGAGDIAPEIARLARERDAHLIVMGLHSSPDRRQHMGRVTYELLCQAPAVVIAWPPARPGITLAPQRTKDVVIV